MVERSRDWLEQANRDLQHSRKDLEDGYYDWASFSAQQAAEKAVKGLLQSIGAEAWGHSVASLVEEVKAKTHVPDELVLKALELDKAYIGTRYPNAHQRGAPYKLYTRAEAERFIEHAQEIVRFCEGKLPKV